MSSNKNIAKENQTNGSNNDQVRPDEPMTHSESLLPNDNPSAKVNGSGQSGASLQPPPINSASKYGAPPMPPNGVPLPPPTIGSKYSAPVMPPSRLPGGPFPPQGPPPSFPAQSKYSMP